MGTDSNHARIEIIGAGLVGSATGAALASWGHDIVYKELLPEKREQLTARGEKVVAPEESVEADLSLVCVPTPYDSTAGELDMSYVEGAIELLEETAPADRVVGIRSTVLPGTTARLGDIYRFDHIAMVPEFLFAATAIEDARNVETVVIGTDSERAHAQIEAVYTPETRDPTVVHLRPVEAELLKMTSNAYGATKISFANEMWRIAESVSSASHDRVLDVFREVSPWVGNTKGLAGGWPYGGACLPKDTNGLMGWVDDREFDAPQLEGTIAENELMSQRGIEADATQGNGPVTAEGLMSQQGSEGKSYGGR